MRAILTLIFGCITAVSAGSARAAEPTPEEIGEIRVYLTPDQALREVFTGMVRADSVRAVLTSAEVDALHRDLGVHPPSDSVTVLVPRAADGALLGFAMIVDEKGKYRPITFLVGVSPERRVLGVEVLVYRESRGGEVRRARFLNQYRGKTTKDAVRTNRDILNIAGATISVNSMNQGVKRALLTLDALAARGAL